VAYSDYVKALEDAESARKSSLESRGINVITTSGTLVTLLFGLVAVLTAAKAFVFPAAGRPYLAAAMLLFVAACGLGIVVNLPLFYKETELTIQELQRVWTWPIAKARSKIAVTRLQTIASARRANAAKAWLLFGAGIAETLALVSLFVAVLKTVY
jgi:hypothetical protein